MATVCRPLDVIYERRTKASGTSAAQNRHACRFVRVGAVSAQGAEIVTNEKPYVHAALGTVRSKLRNSPGPVFDACVIFGQESCGSGVCISAKDYILTCLTV